MHECRLTMIGVIWLKQETLTGRVRFGKLVEKAPTKSMLELS